MRKVCIINNYNYNQFLSDCLNAIFNQTVPFDQIIAIDDGSTDDSRKTLEAFASRNPSLLNHFKENGGQLSCLNVAANLITDQDMVVLCDSDDVLPRDYVELIHEKHEKRLADLFFCEPREFNTLSDSITSSARENDEPDYVLACSSALVRRFKSWIGSPTSCISMSGRLYRAIFPYPHEEDWRTRADDVAVYGASLLGMRKMYMPSLRVGYRVHGSNLYFGRKSTPIDEVIRHHRLEKLFGWFCSRQSIPLDAPFDAVITQHALVHPHLHERFYLPSQIIPLSKRARRKQRVKRFFRKIKSLLNKKTQASQ